jgi:hypothetical protein
MYKIRKVIYEPIEVEPKSLMTLTEAAKELGISLSGVARAIDSGSLREVIDTEASYHGHRLVFRKEVSALKEKKN